MTVPKNGHDGGEAAEDAEREPVGNVQQAQADRHQRAEHGHGEQLGEHPRAKRAAQRGEHLTRRVTMPRRRERNGEVAIRRGVQRQVESHRERGGDVDESVRDDRTPSEAGRPRAPEPDRAASTRSAPARRRRTAAAAPGTRSSSRASRAFHADGVVGKLQDELPGLVHQRRHQQRPDSRERRQRDDERERERRPVPEPRARRR